MSHLSLLLLDVSAAIAGLFIKMPLRLALSCLLGMMVILTLQGERSMNYAQQATELLREAKKEGDYKPILEFCTKWQEIEPQSHALHTILGQAWEGLGRHGLAVQAYRRATLYGSVFAPEALATLLGKGE